MANLRSIHFCKQNFSSYVENFIDVTLIFCLVPHIKFFLFRCAAMKTIKIIVFNGFLLLYLLNRQKEIKC